MDVWIRWFLTLSCAVHCPPRWQGEAGVPCIQSLLGVDASALKQIFQQAKVGTWEPSCLPVYGMWLYCFIFKFPRYKFHFLHECKIARCLRIERGFLRVTSSHNFSSPGKDKSPCIVCINEIDAIGRKRVDEIGDGSDEPEQTLHQKLGEFR